MYSGIELPSRSGSYYLSLGAESERNPSAPASVSELDVAQLEFARIWKQLPKLVFSKSLEGVEGNARLSRADPGDEQ